MQLATSWGGKKVLHGHSASGGLLCLAVDSEVALHCRDRHLSAQPWPQRHIAREVRPTSPLLLIGST